MKFFTILTVSLILFSCMQNSKSGGEKLKIPITTISNKAKDYFLLALQHENKRENEKALDYINQALKLDSTFAMAYMKKAILSGDFDLAKQHLRKAMEYVDEVSLGERLWIKGRNDFYGNGEDFNEYEHFKELVENYPEDENANYLFGLINFSHGNHEMEKAIGHLKKAIELNPNFTNAYNELAYAYLEISDFENARQAALKNTLLLPNKPNSYDTLAEILMREGDYAESIDSYQKVLDLDSTYPWAIMGIAANQNFMDNHLQARKTLKQLDTLEGLSDYEYRHKWKALVVSYLDEGNLESALVVLENQKKTALEGLSPREPFFHAYYSYLRRIHIFFERGDFKSGLEEYNEWQKYVISQTKKENTLSHVENLGIYFEAWSNFLQNDLYTANKLIDDYKDRIEDVDDRYRLLKSKLYVAEGQMEDAVSLSRTLDLSNHYNRYYHGMILHHAKMDSEATKYFEKVCNGNDRNSFELGLVRRRALEHCQKNS